MPGGRPRLFKSSLDALVREMKEEIATHVEVLPPLGCRELL